jgi:murein DD-endopeptidase MepM/ murein hydrolase activator NlpD
LSSQGPLLQAVVSTGQVYQGGTFAVSVPGATEATATLLGRSYVLPISTAGARGYIGIGTGDPAGPALLKVQASDAFEGPVTLERNIEVLRTQWTVDYIWLPPGPGGGDLLDPALIEAENALLATTYGGNSPPMWEEPWITPVDAPISGYFGEQRSFNGGPVGGHHGGTDFAASEGTPVHAVNHGTVVLARELVVRGNMVIVDHGAGVYSGYAHLSSINVGEGQVITKGHIVGNVGTTGLSTGPHLHWEQSVAGILVDGLRWLDGTQGF